MTAILVPAMSPGSAQWFEYMTASKIAAAVGLSTYESPFSLWHRMAGLIPPDEDNDQKRRGHYLEPAIRAWFADQHPDLEISTTGTWVHEDRGWQAASPDALVHTRCECAGTDLDCHTPGVRADGSALCCDPNDCGPCCETCPTCPTIGRPPIALAEFKSAHEDDDWGDPGSDDIPVGYRCQVQWQMDTLGVDTCYVAVLTRHLEFAEYVVHYDAGEAALLRDAGKAFMDSLATGDRPDIDAHGETYRAIRQLHPDIEPFDVELDEDLVRQYCQARAALRVAEIDEQLAKSLVADALGRGRRARFKGKTIAHRQAKGEGTPYLVASRTLPTFSPKAA